MKGETIYILSGEQKHVLKKKRKSWSPQQMNILENKTVQRNLVYYNDYKVMRKL